MKRLKPYISIFLVVLLLCSDFNAIVVKAAPAVENLPDLKLYTTADANIAKGQKGVEYAVSTITMEFNSSYTPDLSKLKIYAYASGKTDETGKFKISLLQAGKVEFKLLSPYTQLRMHTLYEIYAPQGAFTNTADNKTNSEIIYNFVTKGNGKNDILVKTNPSDAADRINKSQKTIEIEFIDDIALNAGLQTAIQTNNKAVLENYIQLSSLPLTNPVDATADAYGTGDDSISNYNISVQGKKLVLEAKSGQLKDFADYSVELKQDAVYLKNSTGTKIYNAPASIHFKTNNMLVKTTPADRQTGVEADPAIEFEFKYPVIRGAGNITLVSDAEPSILLPYTVTCEGKFLKINVDDIAPNTYPLRKNTLYKVTLEEGAVEFKDYKAAGTGDAIKNKKIDLYFTTGNAGESPVVKSSNAYSSDINGNDDITGVDTTRLAADGSIYIRFEKPVRWEKQLPGDLSTRIANVHLYRIPKASSTAINTATGETYDQSFVFTPSGDDILLDGRLDHEDVAVDPQCEILLENAEILTDYPNVLRIKPKYPLTNLNKYRVVIDKDYIEDLNGYNLQKDLDFTFWTAKSNETVKPNWQTSRIPAFDAPQYGGSEPIVLYIDREVIPRAQDKVVQEAPEKIKIITFDALKDITLINAVYSTDSNTAKIDFSQYKLEYYFENNIKKTKLSLYPASALQSGTLYKLSIPGNILQTRGGIFTDPLEINFTVKQDTAQAKGVYSIVPKELNVRDLYWGNGSFLIKGFNFNEKIEKVILKPLSGNASGKPNIEIGAGDIVFKSVTELLVCIRGDNAKTLGQESYTGEYQVVLKFTGDAAEYISPVNFVAKSKGRPVVKARHPGDGSVWYDEKTLYSRVYNGETKYFIKVTFEDIDGNLVLNDFNAIKNSTIYVRGSGMNLLDLDFLNSISGLEQTVRESYIFEKNRTKQEAYLYIPVKPLRPQTVYDVAVSANIVHFSDSAGESSGNETITWEFTTMGVPAVKAITPATVVEDYDEDVPVKITGNLFYSGTVAVYFNDVRARSVIVREDPVTKEKYLEVYLPKGSSRLKAGTYNVTVQNTDNHQRILYGAFSVVPAGKNVPNGQYKVKGEDRKGEIRADLKVSEDTLMLETRYADDSYLKFDMDELMGENVLVRKIQYRGRTRDVIGELAARSKWADITVYGLTLDPASDDTNIILSLGRAEPALSQSLKAKLKGRAIKSEFIQVAGSNYKFYKVVLDIPFRESDGKNIRVLRYDEELRNFYEVEFYKNLADKKVHITSDRPGVFVVVE